MSEYGNMTLDELRELESDIMASEGPLDEEKLRIVRNHISQKEYEQESQVKQEERKQGQEAQKEAIALPKDYSALFDDQRANEEILSLVGQVQEQCFAYMDSVIEQLEHEQLHKMRDLQVAHDEEVFQLKRQNDELQKLIQNSENNLDEMAARFEKLKKEHEELRAHYDAQGTALQEAELRAKDAESKRDAAVKQVDSLKDDINELEQRLAASKPRKQEFKLNLSSGISDNDPNNPRIKTSMEIVLDKFKLNPPVLGGQPEGESFREENTDTEQPSANEAVQDKVEVDFREDSGEVQANESELAQEESAGDGSDLRTLDEAFRRIEALERRVFAPNDEQGAA